MKKEELAKKINKFFKDYDTYNYNDNIGYNVDEEETISEIAKGITDLEKLDDMIKQLTKFHEEAILGECFDESKELESIIKNLEEFKVNNKLLIVKVEPDKLPQEKYIINDLNAMQSEVNGLIEMVDIDDNVCIVCNEEGKILNLELNRVVGNDIIAGSFFIVGFNDEGDTVSLTEEQAKCYKEKYNQKSINEVNEKLVNLMFERGGKELC
ncbi:MAG: DUF3846 domain-containing protein [Bacilli bacterium]|nr:DUF3846 domain-containing protein [Bacilli bacterium]